MSNRYAIFLLNAQGAGISSTPSYRIKKQNPVENHSILSLHLILYSFPHWEAYRFPDKLYRPGNHRQTRRQPDSELCNYITYLLIYRLEVSCTYPATCHWINSQPIFYMFNIFNDPRRNSCLTHLIRAQLLPHFSPIPKNLGLLCHPSSSFIQFYSPISAHLNIKQTSFSGVFLVYPRTAEHPAICLSHRPGQAGECHETDYPAQVMRHG